MTIGDFGGEPNCGVRPASPPLRGERIISGTGKTNGPYHLVAVIRQAFRRLRAGDEPRAESATGGVSEWDYGDYEGLLTTAVHRTRPDWYL